MHIPALIVTACLVMVHAGTGSAASAEAAVVPVAALVPLVVPMSGEADGEVPGDGDGEATPAAERSPARDIVAGLLTGSLAAVLTLRIFWHRRRRDDAGGPTP